MCITVLTILAVGDACRSTGGSQRKDTLAIQGPVDDLTSMWDENNHSNVYAFFHSTWLDGSSDSFLIVIGIVVAIVGAFFFKHRLAATCKWLRGLPTMSLTPAGPGPAPQPNIAATNPSLQTLPLMSAAPMPASPAVATAVYPPPPYHSAYPHFQHVLPSGMEMSEQNPFY